MYCPVPFIEDRPDVLRDLIDQYPLATIVASTGAGLVANHIPLLYVDAEGTPGKLIGHTARNNPLWRTSPNAEVLLIFNGPSAYISPNWYASKRESARVVPTWNYAVVHVYATLRAIHEPDALLRMLSRLTDRHEAGQSHPWRVDDAPAEFTQALLEHIVGLEFRISRIEGKFKMSQNQAEDNQRSIAVGLDEAGGEGTKATAMLVRRYGSAKETR